MSSVVDAPVMDRSARAEAETTITGHAWLRWIRALLCGAEGSTRACRIAISGFLVGTFLFSRDIHRVMWLSIAAPAAFLCVNWRSVWPSARQDSLRLAATHFLCWMTVRSLLAYGMVDGDSGMVAAWWMFGSFLLAAFGVLVWHAAQRPAELEALGRWAGLFAAIAAAVSFVLFYLLLPGHVFGERLMNWFVYGGWNPVSTGLTFGFAAMWLVCLRERAQSRGWSVVSSMALVVLLLAVCFTRSRGALLAVFVGYAVLTLARGWRRTWRSWALLMGVIAAFIFSGPVVAGIATLQSSSAAASGVVAVKPVREMMQRRDGGRFDLYSRAMQTMTGPERWIFGIGQWGPEEACCRSLSKLQYHLHSGFFATFIHGGLIGLGLLLATLGIAVRRGLSLARNGGPDTWLVLLAYGCAGLLFDGQTFASFTSIPQMETLLFAFPLVAAASVWWHQNAMGRIHPPVGRASSRSEVPESVAS